jgi:hypothetical protein
MSLCVLFHRFKNTAFTRKTAQALFPGERWIKVEPHIWAAESRLVERDTVVNGEVTELKTVSGNRSTLGTDFRQGYKQGAAILQGRFVIQKHSVFIRLLSNLEVDSVRAKIAGELKNRTGEGRFICYFETIGKLYTWTFEELRSIIGR